MYQKRLPDMYDERRCRNDGIPNMHEDNRVMYDDNHDMNEDNRTCTGTTVTKTMIHRNMHYDTPW